VRLKIICCSTDGDADLIEKGKALLEEVACTYITKRAESMDTIDEMPEIRFYYEGVEVCCMRGICIACICRSHETQMSVMSVLFTVTYHSVL